MPLANSLYCCAGGFSTGATQAGHTVKLAVDNSEEALACHTDNHPKTEHLLLELGDATHSTLIAKLPPPATRETPWHLHGSPPCQLLSKAHGMGARQDRWGEAMANVAYFLRVVRQTQPSGWTMEEVANPTLLEYFDEQRRAEPDLIDYDVFDMYQYGVCQTRKRFIAGSPRLIRRLRDYRDPSSHKRVADVCPDRPPDAMGIQGNSATKGKQSSEKFHKAFQAPNKQRTLSERVKPGGLTGPAPAVCSGGHLAWTRAHGEVIRALSTEELAALQTFPKDYKWPATKSHAQPLIGNAIPPHFAETMMTDYPLPEAPAPAPAAAAPAAAPAPAPAPAPARAPAPAPVPAPAPAKAPAAGTGKGHRRKAPRAEAAPTQAPAKAPAAGKGKRHRRKAPRAEAASTEAPAAAAEAEEAEEAGEAEPGRRAWFTWAARGYVVDCDGNVWPVGGGDAIAPVEVAWLRSTHAELKDAEPAVAAETVSGDDGRVVAVWVAWAAKGYRVDADGRVRRGVGGDAVELTPVEVMKLRKGDPELKAADPVDAHVVARSLAAAAAEGAEGVYARLLQQQ